ncbi:hypothetical protein LOZ39_002320 [Ophidiomyces ophidiicola]|nr:hypothetical protein LOZ49_001418 [Ophidiomyces ophidiicola]KAI2077273.1 hypothetical protein LOZ39_002320 [Ophidiomyces ophidiicola]KAI2137230.1 hypothetical protein LOZ29_003249 [Ophidiomyces ophidiicola]KAI2427348.1 hypothetical protein LOZ52_003235 [Ophidiomyces ophidiicola]
MRKQHEITSCRGVYSWLDEERNSAENTGGGEYTRLRSRLRSEFKVLYDAGVPMFPKETIRATHEQLEQPLENGKKIVIYGMDGVPVYYDIEVGNVDEDETPESFEYVMRDPCLSYRTYQSIMRYDYMHPYLTFAPIELSHYRGTRNKITKEFEREPLAPYEEIEKVFNDSKLQWEAGETCKQLRSTLMNAKVPLGIDKIVGLSLGRMAEHMEEYRARPAVQHAMVLTLQDVMAMKLGSSSIKCYAQDPWYSEVDISLLENSGITILDDPEAWLEIDDSSIVFSVASNAPVKQIVSDIARPAVIIWEKMREGEIDEERYTTDPYSPRVRDMLRDFYDEFEFLRDEENFSNLAIFIRRTESAD